MSKFACLLDYSLCKAVWEFKFQGPWLHLEISCSHGATARGT